MDKPAGKTSHEIVGAVRRATGTRRVGHTGTLDPFATGILPILIGRATRLARFLSQMEKTYTGEIVLGKTTDSGDATGEVIDSSESWHDLTAEQVSDAMAGLTGRIHQVPPSLSSKKIGGIPAHRRVRRGESVTLPAVEVDIRHFTQTTFQGGIVGFETLVSSGTYIRSLAADLGARLGCGAHLQTLRRTRVGPFEIDEAVALADLSPARVRSARHAIQHLGSVTVDGDAQADLEHGRVVPVAAAADGTVAMLGPAGLIGVGEMREAHLHPRVVLSGS